MNKTNYYSDYITPIPEELKTEKMINLYEYLYKLQTKNRPQDFNIFRIIQGITDERINRLGFILHDNYTLKSLTDEKGSVNIYLSTDNKYDKLILKYDYINKNKIKNPFENEFKTLIHYMNQMNYKGIEFKKDTDLNVFFYKNHKVRAEMIELREYIKENNFEFLRMCGTNISPGQFDIFDYGLFIDYKTKILEISEYADSWITDEVSDFMPDIYFDDYFYPRTLEHIKIVKDGKLYIFDEDQPEDDIKQAQEFVINWLKSCVI